MLVYNKLVRDKIPEIIEKSGKKCSVEILTDDEYIQKLEEKLNEELQEYYQDKNIEELADLLEVLQAVTLARGYTLEQLEDVRAKKAQKRGGFANKILLKSVEEN